MAEDAWLLLQKTAAATLAWVIAKFVFDHPEPFFAPVAAVVALNTSLAISHNHHAAGRMV